MQSFQKGIEGEETRQQTLVMITKSNNEYLQNA